MPILYVSDMAASVAFYEQLGFAVDVRSRSDGWTELKAGDGALLALHVAEPGAAGTIELSMVATEPLEHTAAAVRLAREITDEAFGRSLIMRDPDGVEIQVNENDRELYV